MKQDINVLISEYKEGNAKTLDEILNLVKPVIVKTANSFYADKHTKEDLVQQGYIIVMDSIKTYDQSKNMLYYGYLKKCLYYNFCKMLRRKETPCLNEPIDGGLELLDTASDKGLCVEDEVISKEINTALHKAISSLPKKQRQVIIERYFNTRNLKEVAAEQGVNYITLLRKKRKALCRLKKILENFI